MSHKNWKNADATFETWECNRVRLRHAISVFDSHSTFYASNDDEYVRLHFGIYGDYEFHHKQLDRSFDLTGGHHNVMFSKGLGLEIQNKTLKIETFGVDFPKDLFIQYTAYDASPFENFNKKVQSGEPALLSERWGTLNVSIQKVIDEIIQNPYTEHLQEIFLQAKTLELLVFCLDDYQQKSSADIPFLKQKADKEKVIAARDFINSRVSDPPTLSEIAKYVGLNEFKLKNGFKEMFQSTVFDYLTERRLNLAKQDLTDTSKSINEISQKLGYSSSPHFSSAFKRKFGMSPGAYRGSGKIKS